MRLYRLCMNDEAEDLSGLVGMRVPNHWSDGSCPCIYAHSSVTNCLMENRIYISTGEIGSGMVIIEYDLPKGSIENFSEPQLPEGWQSGNLMTRKFGSDALKMRNALVLGFPSTIMANDEFTYIINPVHPLISKVRINQIFKPLRQ